MTVDVSTPVVVLSAKTHGSLGIIRTLGRLGVPIYAVDSATRGPGSYSRYLRRRSIIEIGAVDDQAMVDHLLRVGAALGTRAILIPTWDETSLMASDHYDRLSERFILPHQPAGLARRLSDKREMAALAREHGVPTPDIVVPRDRDAVAAFAETAVFPVLLKGIDGNRLFTRTGRKMVIVGDRAELLRLYAEMEDPDDPNLMLQEYIPGGDDTVWMFNGYFDASSEARIGITGRKLRQTPVYTGATSLGVVLPNDEVDATTRRWMRELGYRGILDIGYRYDARDGRYKVLDVNPRVGATFRLFVDRNGLDVVRALYLDLTGQPVVAAEPRWGRKWIVEKDLASSWRYWRDGKLGIGEWLTSFRGVEEAGYFATDDLRPFGHAVRNQLFPRGKSTGGAERM